MWLPWQDALWLAAVLAVLAVALRVRIPSARWLWFRDVCQEGAIVAVLYATWQREGALHTHDTTYAVARGTKIVSFEHALHFPSEVWAQQIALHSHLLIKTANWYYILGHAPAMGIFLVWLYVRHKPDFARWRTALAFSCITGELIQIIPVAPPRLTMPGIVDTAQRYGPQVYDSNGAGFAPQLAAMPSLHCAWAITTGLAIFLLVKSRWRWIGPAHATFTVITVVITGNHYWLDAIVGGGLVLVGVGLYDLTVYLWRRRPGAPGQIAALPDESGDMVDATSAATMLPPTY